MHFVDINKTFDVLCIFLETNVYTFVKLLTNKLMLEKEFKYYLANQDELLKKYSGKIIVIKGEKVIGVYNSELEALSETRKEHELGTFLIQKCSAGNNDFTETYHSRVLING